MTYYHEGNGMDDTASDGWVASSLAYLTGTCTDLPWRDATSERTTAMTETQAWPFDAYQDDPLAALRIPVIGTPFPGWRYEVALVCPDSEAGQDLYPAQRPDDAEVRQIAAYIEYRMEYYNSSWKAKMRKRPLDVDSSTNTAILWKRGEGDWCYRRDSWRTGPLVVPSRYDGEEPAGLEALLDRINDYGGEPNPKWRAFKAAHPEAFPASGEETAR